jgi:hypothetical protein
LKFALKLFTVAVDGRQVIVGQLAPLLFNFAFELLPIPFHTMAELSARLGSYRSVWSCLAPPIVSSDHARTRRGSFFPKGQVMPIILWLLGVPLVLVVALYLLNVI